MNLNQGVVTFDGVGAIESASITDVIGISPSVAILEIYPEFGLPSQFGTLTFSYNGNQITWPDCMVDAYSVQQNSGGKTVRLRIYDSRWRWAYGQITGRYNIRLPNNFVDPRHEATPQQLAALCFQAMGVQDFDASQLPDDARPDIDWFCANPAQELAKMCDSLGCRIVPKRSTGQIVICQSGNGADLPNDIPFVDPFEGIDPKWIPDYVQVVTAPVSFQVSLQLQAIGKDTDLSWNELKKLSYCPNPSSTQGDAYGFGYDYVQFSDLSKRRVVLGDGTKISPRELALQTLFKCWRIEDEPTNVSTTTAPNGDPAFWLPGYQGYVTRKQLILTDSLVQGWTDYRGEPHKRPSYIWGEFNNERGPSSTPNYPAGTRIDYQGNRFEQDPEEPGGFSVSLHPIDTDLSIIQTSRQMRFVRNDTKNPDYPAVPGAPEFITTMDPAKLLYTCTVHVRDPDTWQPVCAFEVEKVGSGDDQTHVWTFVKQDIQPWVITLYNSDGTPSDSYNNSDEVTVQCQYYLQQIIQTLQLVATGTRTYVGFYPIDMDGAITQVTYRLSKAGSDTIVSKNTEHDFDLPPYAERRQRDGRQNIDQRLDLMREIQERARRLQGTFNT